MARQFVAFFLLVFSSLVIVFGGYNCSQQQLLPPTQEGSTPILVVDDDDENDWGRPENLRDRDNKNDTSNKGCKRRQYQQFVGKWGASVLVDLSERGLKDFRMGRESNYGVKCPRIFLDMERVEGSSSTIYEGVLRITFEDTAADGQRGIIPFLHVSGDSSQDNRFNTWQGDWRAGSQGDPNVNFVAIFESADDDKPGTPSLVSALILRISTVRRVEVGDGARQALKGAGSVWFKMFRQFRRKEDVCYREGGYAHLAPRTISLPNKRCWFVDRGPYSCLPKGIGTLNSFNLRGELTCYKKLLDFEYLDVHRAFNLKSDQQHP